MKKYVKEKTGGILGLAAALAFINLFFGVICATSVYIADLLYLDAVLLGAGAVCLVLGYQKWKKVPAVLEGDIEENKETAKWLLGRQTAELLCRMEQRHKEEVGALLDNGERMADYITQWAHEVKLPLSALKLMNERNPDATLQKGIQDCTERIQQHLNTMMMSCKLSSMENDVRYEKLELKNVVNEALRNQSYFLIQKHFQIQKDLGELSIYSDRRWLAYILDQLIGNAIKYCQDEPELLFEGVQVSQDEVLLRICDNGIGIREEEIPYIFDRGYIGSNLRDGDYRSTGMGLYFVQEMARNLGIRIQVWSEPGQGTKFELHFYMNAAHFNM